MTGSGEVHLLGGVVEGDDRGRRVVGRTPGRAAERHAERDQGDDRCQCHDDALHCCPFLFASTVTRRFTVVPHPPTPCRTTAVSPTSEPPCCPEIRSADVLGAMGPPTGVTSLDVTVTRPVRSVITKIGEARRCPAVVVRYPFAGGPVSAVVPDALSLVQEDYSYKDSARVT